MWRVACGQSLAPWLIPIRDLGLDFRPILLATCSLHVVSSESTNDMGEDGMESHAIAVGEGELEGD